MPKILLTLFVQVLMGFGFGPPVYSVLMVVLKPQTIETYAIVTFS